MIISFVFYKSRMAGLIIRPGSQRCQNSPAKSLILKLDF